MRKTKEESKFKKDMRIGLTFTNEQLENIFEYFILKSKHKELLTKERERIINKLIDIAENKSIGECIEYIYKLKEEKKKMKCKICEEVEIKEVDICSSCQYKYRLWFG